jgi:homoserine O-acetyltransferase
VQARFLVISFSSDWLYPPVQSRELVRQLKRAGTAVTYLNLETDYGHDSFLIENPPFADVLGHFLNGEHAPRPKSAGAPPVAEGI